MDKLFETWRGFQAASSRESETSSSLLTEKAKSRAKRRREQEARRRSGEPQRRPANKPGHRGVTRALTRRMFALFQDKGIDALEEMLTDPSALRLNMQIPHVNLPRPLAKASGIQRLRIELKMMKPEEAAHMRSMMPRGVYVGGSARVQGTAIASDQFQGGIGFSVFDKPTTLTSRVYIDPTRITSREDIIRALDEIYLIMTKNVEHEYRHVLQFDRGGKHAERYSQVDADGKIKIDPSNGKPYPPPPEGIDPDRVFWQKQDPLKDPTRTVGARYVLSAHETEAHVRGFYKESVKSRGKLTFEELVDERVDAAGISGLDEITPAEQKQMKSQYMEYAREYLPCAKLLNGKAIDPKRCRSQKKIARRFFSEMGGRINVDPRGYRPGWGTRIFGAVMLTFMWAELANAAETAESAGIDPSDPSLWPKYAAILADHGISIVDPTFGAWEITKGLYRIIVAEDPYLAARSAGETFQKALFLPSPGTTAISPDREIVGYRPNPEFMGPPIPIYKDLPPATSQEPQPMLPMTAKTDPRVPEAGQPPPTVSRPRYVQTTKKPVLVQRTDLQRGPSAPAVAPRQRYPKALRGAWVHPSRVVYANNEPVLRPEDWGKGQEVYTTAIEKEKKYLGEPAPAGLFEGCRKQKKMVVKIKKN